MKKITLLTVVLAAMSFASCKKDYTCECTTTAAGITSTASVTINDTKKNAKSACDAKASSASVGGVSASTTCAIK